MSHTGMTKGKDGVWRPKVTPRRQPHRAVVERLNDAIHQLMREAATEYPENATDVAKWEWAEVTARLVMELFKRREVLGQPGTIKKAQRAVRRGIERETANKLLELTTPSAPTPPKPGGQPKDNEVPNEDNQVPRTNQTTGQLPTDGDASGS